MAIRSEAMALRLRASGRADACLRVGWRFERIAWFDARQAAGCWNRGPKTRHGTFRSGAMPRWSDRRFATTASTDVDPLSARSSSLRTELSR